MQIQTENDFQQTEVKCFKCFSVMISHSHSHSHSHDFLLSSSSWAPKSDFTPSCPSHTNRSLFFSTTSLLPHLKPHYVQWIILSHFILILLPISINNSLRICHLSFFSLILKWYSFDPHLMNCLQSSSKMNEIQQTYYTISIYVQYF